MITILFQLVLSLQPVLVQGIVNGQDAPMSPPFFGTIYSLKKLYSSSTPSFEVPHCGATFLDWSTAVTAAHCASLNLADDPVLVMNHPEAEVTKESLGKESVIVMNITQSIFHPRFNMSEKTPVPGGSHFSFDVAVLKLAQRSGPLLTAESKFVQLDNVQKPDAWAFTRLQVVGMGMSKLDNPTTLMGGNAYPKTLQQSSYVVESESKCDVAYQDYKSGNATASFCVGVDPNGSGICQGDSGSPLYYPSSPDYSQQARALKLPTLVGITSWHIGECGKSVEVFTQVSHPEVYSFIQAHSNSKPGVVQEPFVVLPPWAVEQQKGKTVV